MANKYECSLKYALAIGVGILIGSFLINKINKPKENENEIGSCNCNA